MALDVDPSVVTLDQDVEPFTLTPVVADLLRTRYPIPGSIFLVEGVDSHRIGRSGSWQAVRLLLGDGDLCVQALLDDKMHRFVRTGSIGVGSYVRVQDFELRWVTLKAKAEDGKRMVYLLVRDLVTIGQNNTVRALYLAETADAPDFADRDSSTDGKGGSQVDETLAAEEPQLPYQIREPRAVERPVPTTHKIPDGNTQAAAQTSSSKHKWDAIDGVSDTDLEAAFDAIEAHTFPQRNLTASRSQPSTPSHQEPSATLSTIQPIPLPGDWRNPQKPLKLTTLRAVPHLPYPRNWSVNILAIVVELSPVEPSNLLPYRQRTARLADPSTAKQVHLTVFLDPEAFSPKVGNAVLLTGVKNHRFDGGSLKKYASDGKKCKRWWFEEPWELGWCNVRGIKEWWAQMEAFKAEDLDDFEG
ncbi:cyclin-like F-box [Purpureocillium lavendulum]|uniref:Cyclin-like F-box n=1 Tax=Purpureocillium lavendulum TaxID=1247861 RepID=A0AB34FCK0_9HYPO|nr:cyclin-like F-box [Purpureocillium lavendulum]